MARVQVEVDRYQAIMPLIHSTLNRRISTVLLEQSPLKCLGNANRGMHIVVIDMGPENPRLRSLGLNLQHTVHIVDTLGLDKQFKWTTISTSHARSLRVLIIFFLSLVDLFPIAVRSQSITQNHNLTTLILNQPITPQTPQQCTSSIPSSSPP